VAAPAPGEAAEDRTVSERELAKVLRLPAKRTRAG
jgi:hypothetical protein